MNALLDSSVTNETVSDNARQALSRYKSDLIKAHFKIGREYLDELKQIHLTNPTPQALAEMVIYINKMPYLFWAAISSASKRARRRIVMNALLVEKRNGTDIPPSVVHHVGRATLGHGFDEKVVMKAFADKDRTAADKTKTTLSDLKHAIQVIDKDLIDFRHFAGPIRNEVDSLWLNSFDYEKLNTELLTYYDVSVTDVINRGRKHLFLRYQA